MAFDKCITEVYFRDQFHFKCLQRLSLCPGIGFELRCSMPTTALGRLCFSSKETANRSYTLVIFEVNTHPKNLANTRYHCIPSLKSGSILFPCQTCLLLISPWLILNDRDELETNILTTQLRVGGWEVLSGTRYSSHTLLETGDLTKSILTLLLPLNLTSTVSFLQKPTG